MCRVESTVNNLILLISKMSGTKRAPSNCLLGRRTEYDQLDDAVGVELLLYMCVCVQVTQIMSLTMTNNCGIAFGILSGVYLPRFIFL